MLFLNYYDKRPSENRVEFTNFNFALKYASAVKYCKNLQVNVLWYKAFLALTTDWVTVNSFGKSFFAVYPFLYLLS